MTVWNGAAGCTTLVARLDCNRYFETTPNFRHLRSVFAPTSLQNRGGTFLRQFFGSPELAGLVRAWSKQRIFVSFFVHRNLKKSSKRMLESLRGISTFFASPSNQSPRVEVAAPRTARWRRGELLGNRCRAIAFLSTTSPVYSGRTHASMGNRNTVRAPSDPSIHPSAAGQRRLPSW